MSKFFDRLQSLMRNNPIFVGLSTNVVGNVVMFGTTIYLTRVFPVDVYGQFRLIFAFIALSVIVFQLGRDNGIIYYGQCENDEQSLRRLIQAEVLFTFISLSLGCLLLYATTPLVMKLFLTDTIPTFYFHVSLIMIPLWGMFNALAAGMKSTGQINQSFILTNLIQRILRLPFLLVLSLLSVSYYSLAFGMILSQLALVFVAWRALGLNYQFSDIRLINDFFRRLGYSLQLGFNAIIFVLLSRIDVIMLGKLVSDSAVAIYDTVVLLAFVVTLPFITLVKASEVFMQALVDKEEEQIKYNNNLKLAIHLSVAIALFLVLVPSDALHIFGADYTAGSHALTIMATGYLLLCMLGTPIELLNMNGHGRLSAVVLICTIVLNFVLNRCLIPLYGLEGAAIATIVALIFSKVLGLIIVKHYYPRLRLTQLRPTWLLFMAMMIFFLGDLILHKYWMINLVTALCMVCVYFFALFFCIRKRYLIVR